MKNFLNWSEISRFLSRKKDRNLIRPTRIPKKHYSAIDNIVYKIIPQEWEEYKNQNQNQQQEANSQKPKKR
jgi:hypothetical protein